MPTPTYVSLGTITLASTDSEIVFSSIPATYRDLIVVIDGATGSNTDALVRFNGDTSGAYSWVYASGQGTSPISGAQGSDNTRILIGFAPAAARRNHIIQIMDYSATDKHKTALVRTNAVAHNSSMWAGRWANTNAINSVLLGLSTGSWSIGTTASLYGVN